MTKNQKYIVWGLVILLLILILWYYFRSKKKGEKCPDGRSIPNSGNCADNPVLVDANGNSIVTPQTPDVNGCIQPSSYVVNFFPLALGMKGDLVKQVQTVLKTAYKENVVADGYFGCNTLAAIIRHSGVREIDAERFKNVYTINPNI